MSRLSSIACRLLSLALAAGLLLLSTGIERRGDAAPTADEQSPAGEKLLSEGSRRRELARLMSVLAAARRAGDLPAVVQALNRLGEAHLKLHDADSALAESREALSLARQSGDGPLLVQTLVVYAIAYRSRQDTRAALRLLEEAHARSLRLKYRRGEAQSLTELGTIYFQQSELAKAEAHEEAALRLWRELGDREGEARALYYLGDAYMRLGKAQQAAAVLENAAAIWHELGSAEDQASALIDLNFLAIRQGQWKKALALLKEAQLLVSDREAAPFIYGQITTSLGEVYEAYGQLETARGYFEEALISYRDFAHDLSAAADAGRKAGRVLARLGDYGQAVARIEHALALAERVDNRFMAALCREDLGRVHLTAGLYAPAKKEFLAASAQYRKAESRREWARSQAYLGQIDYSQGEMASAAKFYGNSLRVFQEIEDYTNEAAVCFGLGKLELDQGKLEAAGTYLQRSIALTEQLRENAASKDLRTSFLASVHDRYETYVEWLMQRHARQPDRQFDVAAFEASELGRARSLLDSLKDYQKELRQAADPLLLIEEEQLQKEEQQALDKRAKLQSEGGAPEARNQLEAELVRIRARSETLQAQLSSTPSFNNLMRPTPLKLSDIKSQVTDPETTLLEYSLGSRKSYLWVVTPEGLTSYELPAKETIETAAHRLAELLAQPQTEPSAAAELQRAVIEVSRLVLGPVFGQLRSPRLIIVPDGILQYIPFQILTAQTETGEPLVSQFEIVNAPSASTLAAVHQETLSREAAPKLLAAFGDPIFSSNYAVNAPAEGQEEQAGELQARLNRQRSLTDNPEETLDPARVQPLFFARQELNGLRQLAPAGEAAIYSGFDANRENLLNLDLSQYRILHFATHGLLNARQPELSGLVLSLVDRKGQPVTGFVGLSDIYNLHAPVDLVVLSACRTALGKDVRGEGLVGLTRGFMYAGAASVVASLWKVEDEATAELMKHFYTNLLQGGMTPAAALRAAQNSIRQQPQWRAPYYWAAFTLQGDYRRVIKPIPAAAAAAAPFDFRKMVIGGALLAMLAALGWAYRRRHRAT